MTLGEQISTQRKIKGFSQELLAEKCGTSLRTIQRIENNKSKPRPYTLKVIADTLNIKMEDLAQNINSEQEANIAPELETNDNYLSKISLINSSALFGILFPFLNLIAPTLFWKLNNKNSLVSEKGKKVINFQILWSLFSLLILVIAFLCFKITGVFIFRGISIEFIVYLFLLVVNVLFVIKNSFRLNKGNTNIYTSIPNLF